MHLCIYVFCQIFVMQSGTKNLLITRYTREKILDPRNTHEEKFWARETPTGKKLDPRDTDEVTMAR